MVQSIINNHLDDSVLVYTFHQNTYDNLLSID